MHKSIFHLVVLLKRLLILFFSYSLCRLLFYSINYSLFSSVSFPELVFIFVHGLRFDFAAIIYCNIPFILLHLFPLPWRDSKRYQSILKFLFFLFNIPAIAFNYIDFIYFRFTQKRTTSDIFSWTGLGDDLKNVLPKIITDFWFVFLLFAVLVFLMNYLYKKTSFQLKKDILENQNARPYWLVQIAFTILFAGVFVVGVRGGLQLRPLSILSASDGISPKNVTLVLNTPFTVLQTLEKSGLKEVHYFNDKTASDLFSINKQVFATDSFETKNVVVIILESFSKEYIGALNNYKGYTPFLDSLIKESLTFTNAFANGKKSIEGIPSIVAGLPSLMDNPYITSAYSGNQFNSIASLLKKQGYETSFFHGGTNGTMGFDNFTRMAGFDKYYGMKEYNNEKDYDGFWGIYDEPFMQYFAQSLNKYDKPFFSCLFTLSSHHPYTLPKQYKNRFKNGTLEIHPSIAYADYSLQRFFETASRMPWFKNTLFVITADHTSLSEHRQYQTGLGSYRIPILFYQYGSSLKGLNTTVVQQADILPSIMDYLNFQSPFISFGESVFRPDKKHYAISFINNIYQYTEKDYLLQFNGEKSIGLYKYTSDPLLNNNLISSEKKIVHDMELGVKSVIQAYNYSLIHNKLTVQ